MERHYRRRKQNKMIVKESGARAQYLFVFLFCLIVLAGCGKNEGDNDYYIVETESEQMFTRIKNDANTFLLGNRFYLGEAVQLVGYRAQDGATMNVYLCKTSGEEELLWEGIPKEYGYGSWYLDSGGNGYCLYTNEVIRYDRGEGERCRQEKEDVDKLINFCEAGDGAILLVGQTKDGVLKLIELVAEKGELTDTGVILDTDSRRKIGAYISGSDQGFWVLDKEGIWGADAKSGRTECVMAFSGGSYMPETVSDFRILEDGTAQVLQGCDMDTLHSVNISETRTVLVLRIMDIEYLTDWLSESIVRFNAESSEYYVVVEDKGENEAKAFREKTDMELALGKGPDMVLSAVSDPLALMEKGALEDLAPYMEESGLHEEDYFPAAFDCWRDGDKIYGINIVLEFFPGLWVKEELFSGGEEQDLQGLVQALADYQGDAILSKSVSGKGGLLRWLLKASDSLGGTVNWEDGTCDFGQDFFRNLLEVSKKYADRSGEDIPVLGGAADYSLYEYGNIYGNEEELAERGIVCLDFLFDDTHCAAANYLLEMIMVGSGSAHKDGAWEFIRFLLSEEQQSMIYGMSSDSVYPVNRNAFDILAAKELAEGGVVTYETGKDGRTIGHAKMSGLDLNPEVIERYQLTEGKVDSVRNMLENARALPLRTEPIQQIIYEEADAYYSGDRSMEDVCGNIQNRVQLYLNEVR